MRASVSNTLVFDLGNSTVSMALFIKSEIKEHWKIPSVDLESASDFERAIRESLPLSKNELNVKTVIVSCVVLSKTDALLKAVSSLFQNAKLRQVSTFEKSILISGNVPSELGVDLYANAIEARVKSPMKSAVVVDFGTALTFIAVDKDGAIKGVSIAPGVKTSLRSLIQVAPALEGHSLSYPLTSLGYNTEEAINAGVFYSVRGAVKEIVKTMEDEMGDKLYKIATGGHSQMFAPFVDIFDEVDSLHTIKGMYSLFNF